MTAMKPAPREQGMCSVDEGALSSTLRFELCPRETASGGRGTPLHRAERGFTRRDCMARIGQPALAAAAAGGALCVVVAAA